MKWLTVTLVLVAVLACKTRVMAARCSGIAEPARIFCDDFDRWCDPPPGDPSDACAVPATPDDTGFYAFWPQSDGTCSYNYRHELKQDPMWKPTGFAPIVRQNADIHRLTRHVHDMTTEIQANTRNTSSHGAVNGTGAIGSIRDTGSYVDPATMPDVLKGQFFFHTSGNPGASGNFTAYVELNLDDDRAPTDFNRVTCYTEAYGPYQVLQTTDGQVHASFAFGMIAIMDQYPCDVQVGRKPSTEAAVVYDGLNWHLLKFEGVCESDPNVVSPPTGLCMGGATHGGTCTNDTDCTDGAFDLPNDWESFGLWDYWNRFYFYIGTDYIEIRLYNGRADLWYSGEGVCIYNRCTGGVRHDETCCPDGTCDDGTCSGGERNGEVCCPTGPSQIAQPYFVARVPRQYTGPFNRIATGAGPGLDLTTPTCEPVWSGGGYVDRCIGGANSGNTCNDASDCPASVADECIESLAGNNAYEEEFVIYDGVFQPSGTLGACCRVDTGVCENDVTEPECAAPDIWHTGQVCDNVLCCVDPFADADADDDVDQVDFGIWQACYSGDGHTHPDGSTYPCACFNREGSDDDVDGADFIAFDACYSGPTVPANPACD